ncbi:hypothetical protein CYMTET_35811 [Cymbomonas tetramitiformis]|uniref:Uncharacterized protein n=1 Tax=Cymbomonas tetramitiformis TaxID=36881 RepID=A0AAE0F8I0_9CHLO|nr:hypothetical protein CYMTET_35811 [Cymbomonas tetramitiformis]
MATTGFSEGLALNPMELSGQPPDSLTSYVCIRKDKDLEDLDIRLARIRGPDVFYGLPLDFNYSALEKHNISQAANHQVSTDGPLLRPPSLNNDKQFSWYPLPVDLLRHRSIQNPQNSLASGTTLQPSHFSQPSQPIGSSLQLLNFGQPPQFGQQPQLVPHSPLPQHMAALSLPGNMDSAYRNRRLSMDCDAELSDAASHVGPSANSPSLQLPQNVSGKSGGTASDAANSDKPKETRTSRYRDLHLSGTMKVGVKIAAAGMALNDAQLGKCRCQWQRLEPPSAESPAMVTMIPGAEGPYYTISDEDVGSRIRIVCAGINSDGSYGQVCRGPRAP